jgi:hypothetical protein
MGGGTGDLPTHQYIPSLFFACAEGCMYFYLSQRHAKVFVF